MRKDNLEFISDPLDLYKKTKNGLFNTRITDKKIRCIEQHPKKSESYAGEVEIKMIGKLKKLVKGLNKSC